MLVIPLGERIHIFSVGKVELIFNNWFTLCMPRPSSSVFLLHSCSLFVLLTRFIHYRTFLVAIFAVSGCASMLESVLIYNLKPFGVGDLLGESIGVLCRKCGAYF